MSVKIRAKDFLCPEVDDYDVQDNINYKVYLNGVEQKNVKAFRGSREGQSGSVVLHIKGDSYKTESLIAYEFSYVLRHGEVRFEIIE